jgi:hypothetical protein
MPSPLPLRAGDRPRTTPTNPHTQLDQQPTDSHWIDELARRVFALPGVVEEPSRISVPGARALVLAPGEATGPPEAFLIDREFAHLHPAPGRPAWPDPSHRSDALRPARRGGAGRHRTARARLTRIRSPRRSRSCPIRSQTDLSSRSHNQIGRVTAPRREQLGGARRHQRFVLAAGTHDAERRRTTRRAGQRRSGISKASAFWATGWRFALSSRNVTR